MTEPEGPVTLIDALARAAQSDSVVRFLDRQEQETHFSYLQLYQRGLELAGGLQAIGLRPGDRVVLVLPTGVAFYDALFATLLAGMVPVPIYPPLRFGRLDEYQARVAAMITACGARLVLTDAAVRQLLGRAMARARPDMGCIDIEALPRAVHQPVRSQADDLALIQFSSGTTVAPKPVGLTHANILANVAAIAEPIFAACPEEEGLVHRGVSWLPLYHDMGLIGCVMVALTRPRDLVLLPPEAFVARPAIWLRMISRYGGTISPAPNFAYALCVERIKDEEIAEIDLSCWRVALNGAEPVTPGALTRFVERFSRYGLREEALTPVYGLAEATLAVSFSEVGRRFCVRHFDREKLTVEGRVCEVAWRALEVYDMDSGELSRSLVDESLPQRVLSLVSVGRPVTGCEVQIVDTEGQELAEGELGSVRVRGLSVMQGYHGAADKTAAVLDSDGWLDTGDSGFWWRGELYLYGRTKDLIVIRGRNIAAQDVEHALEGVSGVRRGCAAAIGVLEREGEQLIVLVERSRRRKASQSDDELAQEVSRAVTRNTTLVPARVVVLEPGTLPRTSSGKIRRAEARRQYLLDALRPPKPVTAWRLALEVVRSRFGLARVSRGPL